MGMEFVLAQVHPSPSPSPPPPPLTHPRPTNSLEAPCLPHLHGDPSNPSQPCGHALTVSSQLLAISHPAPHHSHAHVPPSSWPDLSSPPSPPSPKTLHDACARTPASILDRLLTLSAGLDVAADEVTPVRAWHRIQQTHQLQRLLITAFFHAITPLRDPSLITRFVRAGLVSPDVPDARGRTPLLAAVEAGSGEMVCALVGLGASVDGWGTTALASPGRGGGGRGGGGGVERTPLMVAAGRGDLALVKLLVGELGADDGLVAPDGQLALRLAADAGHREVVEYLPVRRGGAWRRWRVHHDGVVRRVKRAVARVYWFGAVLVWYMPKFFVWDIPKHGVVKPLVKGCKFCWENKHKFGGWCKRQAEEFPGRAKKAGKAVWKRAKRVPKGVWRVVKGIPGAVKRLLMWLWKAITKIPAAMKKLCVWIWESLKRVGKAVGHVFLRVVAVLHTAVAAVLDSFRNIKLKDVWNGFCDVAEAVFRGLPRAMLTVVSSLGIVVAGVIIGIFGFTGKLIVWFFEALWYVAKYVPRQLAVIVSGIWTSIAKGYHEIMVWINPKH
ncbi:hypothetical protein B0I37DRAFT_441540 [Chaetomium sp. MPI-CAGE-AT-0009]|nr:hypothetical protein B0I37DRAFT_441540 [Chaetomium sp. MPI-CAGE-AT-0009]